MEMEEIIKGLRRCADRGGCEKCPYEDTDKGICIDNLMYEAADALESQLSRIAEVEKQLEAAARDLEYVCGSSGEFEDRSICDICRHKQADGTCPKQCEINSLAASNKWEWRGCKAEEGETNAP